MDAGKSDISIVLVTRNSRSVLFDCLKSLEENDEITKSPSSEWIIVDNNSTDGSIEDVIKLYPSVKVIKNKENLGFAKACNQGCKISSRGYILFINTDTKIQQNAISKLYSYISKDNSIGVIGPRLIRKDESIQKSVYPEPSLLTEIFKPFVKLTVSLKENFYSENKCYDVNSLRGACFIVNRQIMEKAGYFDERYFFYLEETDLFRQIRLGGNKICYLPYSRVYHYGGLGCDDKASFDKKKIYKESMKKYFEKNRNKFENFIMDYILK
ncbi:MAG: glycosyltransferase family 2 protein [Endomicrobia bacterium]|nr:glycosyltransferase family 2 protein [Endomicrobiia bacterium]MCL2798796.1 glycosyltransferase family 2 protein [Endomicrobiia bacterium]